MNTESRIALLEERLTWLQQHATEQDKVINFHALEINKLAKSLLAVKIQMSESESVARAHGDASVGEGLDERPPHY